VKTIARLFIVLLSLGDLAAHGTGAAGENTTTNPAAAVSASPTQPFTVKWSAAGQFQADVSFLLHAPTGRGGFIGAKDGHLVLPDGARFRIWCLNATMAAALPSKEHAPIVAANLARRGINCVRLHFLDRLSPVGLIAADRNDTRALDGPQMDRLDFFNADTTLLPRSTSSLVAPRAIPMFRRYSTLIFRGARHSC
jgi:hypothetical protein